MPGANQLTYVCSREGAHSILTSAYIPHYTIQTWICNIAIATCAVETCERWMSNGMRILCTPSKLMEIYESIHI